MSVDWREQKIIFVDDPKNPIAEQKSILQPLTPIINIYTLIAVFYCASFAFPVYYVVGNIFLAVIILVAVLSTFSSFFDDKRIGTSQYVKHLIYVLNEAEQILSLANLDGRYVLKRVKSDSVKKKFR